MFGLFKKKKVVEQKQEMPLFSTHVKSDERKQLLVKEIVQNGMTFDSVSNIKDHHAVSIMPDEIWNWFVSQTFIGHHISAQIATHWLVDKACAMPARDVIRRGYTIDCDCTDHIVELTDLDEHFDLSTKLKDFIHQGRVFGGQLALYVVEHTDPDYYENPFNMDAVKDGNYKGIALIDPVNVQALETADNFQDPANLNYMKPTYYQINGRKYHRSHFEVFIPFPVANNLKRNYNYFGVPLPQRIYERVYAAERTANEAPILTMTKRTGVLGVNDLSMQDGETLFANLNGFLKYRDNHGVLVTDAKDNYIQQDTALADVDSVIMTQYQLVASIAQVPATKLLGTTPKGFNSSGDYEESSYREELESISTNDAVPFLKRHYEMLSRSLGRTEKIEVVFNPMDSPTAKEQAEINNLKAQSYVALFNAGAIDSDDVAAALKLDKDSDFYGIETDETIEEETELDRIEREAEADRAGTSIFEQGNEEL